MPKTFHKTKPLVSLNVFLTKSKEVSKFTSARGRRYLVTGIENDEMIFRRLDAKEDVEWRMNLNNVYRAYQELEDFATINFKPFVPLPTPRREDCYFIWKCWNNHLPEWWRVYYLC